MGSNPLKVAFLGLGALGEPMAANLLTAGVALTVHNRTRAREEPLAARGARRAATAAAAAADADLLAICVSDGPDVEAVLFGADGAAEALRPGALVVDFSSIDPAVSQQLAARLRLQGVAYLDAPVTGGTEGARAGSLSVLVGGAPADLERARPVLEVVGGRITHFGPVGAGQQAKAVNQVLLAGSYTAVAEGLSLAKRLGLPLDLLVEALKGGAAGSWALEHRSGAMVSGHFPLGFKLELHRKDLGIALAAASALQLELPISAQVAAIEDELIAAGFGTEDVAALARWYGQSQGPTGSVRTAPGTLRS
ncbi:NAD(P)-dependent oxidoreductase [Cyanobium sp. Morenito 9A2]|nr:NAD(P)-dependent oxidoreductase [Cyanobium sp. Morenito 9A2]